MIETGWSLDVSSTVLMTRNHAENALAQARHVLHEISSIFSTVSLPTCLLCKKIPSNVRQFLRRTGMMSFPDVEQPPLKKRRFFAEESPPPDQNAYFAPPEAPHDVDALHGSSLAITKDASIGGSHHISNEVDTGTQDSDHTIIDLTSNDFDKQIFESFVGQEVSEDVSMRLEEISENNMERAINMYLDGSWRNASVPSAHSESASNLIIPSVPIDEMDRPESFTENLPAPSSPLDCLEAMPQYRYVGAFGVGAWATRSGTGLVKHGESVKIERTKIKPKPGRGGRSNAARMRTDIVVRFTNINGDEIGRLPQDTALWVSTLMDQKVCRFDGACVFSPERVRVNDTIYLQLRCSLLQSAFEAEGFVKPEDNNRTTGIFEEKETSAEKGLRLRQVALVKLFEEINLHPSTINETTAKHKREGILQAAEVAEHYDKEKDNKKPKPSQEPGSSPPAGDETEDGKELEQDQLDSLYKKAQSFDFDTPTREPAETFSMDLRKYQKQALHWMMSKEKDEKSEDKQLSMHPLWEEYSWPTKDMDDQDVPVVVNQGSFYVNPYSGELSLEFPVHEQHCLGGILADGMISLLLVGKVAN